MLLSWLSKLLASLLVASLCGLIATTMLNQTVLNNKYIEGQLDKTNAYSRLSVALSTEVGKQPDVASDPAVAMAVAKVLTPDVLKQQINTSLDKLTLYYQGKGPAPSIDLSGYVAQLQAAGVPVMSSTDLQKPISLVPASSNNGKSAHDTLATLNGVRTTSIVTTALLALALLAISWRRRRYGVLPGVVIWVGVLVGIGALALYAAPGLFDHYVKFDTASNAFASLGHDLATSIAHDLGRRFGVIAGVCLVLGIATRILASRLQRKTSVVAASGKVPKSVTR